MGELISVSDPAVMRRRLESDFSDTLNKGNSLAGILVQYQEKGALQLEVGIPYRIHDKEGGILEVGPYVKHIGPMPRDFHQSIRLIPLSKIVGYMRIEVCKLYLSYIFEKP